MEATHSDAALIGEPGEWRIEARIETATDHCVDCGLLLGEREARQGLVCDVCADLEALREEASCPMNAQGS